MNTSNKKNNYFILFALLFAGLGILIASEEEATESVMAKLMEFKEQGFVNVRGERRGFLEKQGTLKQRIKLYKGQEYLAIVSGDSDVEKVQVIILNKKGKEVARSDGGTKTASITYIPEKKDKYSFIIEAPGKGGYYQFSLVTK
ncbi:MAG: hypothetical protein HQL32_06185 [Planctomycetes bacterium]|nr:hypothetical protein [Planctomycetota bacterium]